MADVAQKAISANDMKLGSVTVKTGGGNGTNGFDHDYERAQTNPDKSTAAYWDAKLDARLDDPRYYEGDTIA